MTAKYLINIARSRLGDTRVNRWTDLRLLQIVNQGQANICKLTGIYRKEVYIALLNGETRYRLPNDCMTVRRISYRDEVVAVYNRDDLDIGKAIINDFVGVKDNVSMGVLDIYPPQKSLSTDLIIIQGPSGDVDYTVTPLYGVVVAAGEPLDIDMPYGVVTGLQLALDPTDPIFNFGELASSPWHPQPQIGFNPDVYGVTIEAENIATNAKSLFGFITDSKVADVYGQYGVVTNVSYEENTMRIFYEAVPTGIKAESDTLVIPNMWEEAMLRYIVGTALQDDNDANNINRGELELQKYTAEVMKARELASKDFSGGTKEKYHTRYRRI